MSIQEPLNFEQPKNKLSEVADAERAKLFPKNDFKTTNQYSSTNPDAIGDGDEIGRGTGSFLDVYNVAAGTSTDVFERKMNIKFNAYQPNKPYRVED